MVAPHEHRQDRGSELAAVVLVKLAEGAVLGRAGEALEVVKVANRLEVAADDQELDFAFVFF